jgi:hypothetical protein
MRRQIGKRGRDRHDASIESVYRLDVTIDRQTADQTIGPEGFACPDQSGKIRRASLCCQFVRLQRSHNFTIDGVRPAGKFTAQPDVRPSRRRIQELAYCRNICRSPLSSRGKSPLSEPVLPKPSGRPSAARIRGIEFAWERQFTRGVAPPVVLPAPRAVRATMSPRPLPLPAGQGSPRRPPDRCC